MAEAIAATQGKWQFPKTPKLAAHYPLLLITAVYVSNYVDRQILAILIPQIKADLSLTDTQLGLLSGFAFAIFYATLGLPIARLADRSNRRNILVIATASWSGFTALCGLAQNYVQLLIARMCVGIGEAGGGPASMSMISDLYPPERRASAMAVYSLAVPIGSVIGFLVGAFVATHYGWRAAFFAVGLPGLALALIIRVTLAEPTRRIQSCSDRASKAGISDALAFLWGQRSYRLLVTGIAINALVGSGVLVWLGAFLMRTHGLTLIETGTTLALIVGPVGAIGTLAGGWLTDRFSARTPKSSLYVMAFGIIAAIPISIFLFLTDSRPAALGALALWMVFGSLWFGPAFALGQSLAKDNMRALSAAIISFLINLIGYGGGPVAVGLISDALTPRMGDDALGTALAATMVLNILTAFLFLSAGRTLITDLERAR
jgi:predicted MFS family arabinose efflux permease